MNGGPTARLFVAGSAVLIELTGGDLPAEWLGRWHDTARDLVQYPDDMAEARPGFIAARVRARRVGPLLALLAEVADVPARPTRAALPRKAPVQ